MFAEKIDDETVVTITYRRCRATGRGPDREKAREDAFKQLRKGLLDRVANRATLTLANSRT